MVPPLRLADKQLKAGQLAQFKQLVCEGSYRRNQAFQWGLAERLGQIAANPIWDTDTRQNALDFLDQLYRDDATWGLHANVKQWIMQILRQLADTSVSAPAAQTVLQALESHKNTDPQALSRESPSSMQLNLAPPLPTTSVLLDRVQQKLDVESDLRKLKHRRVKAHGDALYIPPQGKPSLQSSDDKLFDLTEKVTGFLQENTKKVCLLLGNSGAGKSTFNRRLEADLWDKYKKSGRIPLFITLPAINQPEHDLITKHLRKEGFNELQIKELKTYREFIAICDGYDESQQTHNLYMSNRLNQAGEWQAQMVISCRSEYLGADYQDRFQPIDRNHHADATLFEGAVIAPFSAQKIASYIEQYVQIEKPIWQADIYQQALDRIPHLKELVRNPFLLKLALEVLPRLVDSRQDFSSVHITRIALYDQFVEQWLERGKKRLAEKDLSGSKKKAFERLSNQGFTQNGLAFLKDLAVAIYERQAGNPVVEYVQFKDKGGWKETFFGRDEEAQLLLEASPLSRSNNQYRFIHKSLLEYSVALAICEPQTSGKDVALPPPLSRRGSVDSVLSFESQHAVDVVALAVEQPLLDSLLARKNLVGESSIVQFLAERVKQEPLFKEQLHAVIERSKTDSTVRKAAANAMTILMRAGVTFNEADLAGIQIPGADLSYGVLDSAQLQGADLRKVNLTCTWLRNADLTGGTRMEGVQFGELPGLQLKNIVNTCCYSSDGRLLVVAYGNIVTLYDTHTLEEKGRLTGHESEVTSVALSADSRYVVFGSRDHKVQVWDWQTPEAAPRVLSGHAGAVTSVTLSADGRYVVSGSEDKTVRVWDWRTPDAVPRVLSGHEGWVSSVALSADGRYVVSGSQDNTVQVWNWQTPEAAPRVLSGHAHPVSSVVMSADGRYVVSGSWDKTVRVWDWQTPEAVPRVLSGHWGHVSSVALSADGRYVVSGSGDKTVRVWDWQTPEAAPRLLGWHKLEVSSVALSADGRYVVSGSWDKTVRVWDWQTPEATPRGLSGHDGVVRSVALTADGRYVVSGSNDKTVRVWDWQTPESAPRVLSGHEGWVMSVALSADGRYVVSGSWDHTVRVWDCQTPEAAHHVLSGHEGWVSSVALSADGRYVVSGSEDKTVRVWDWQTLEAAPRVLSGHQDVVNSVAMSADSRYVLSGSRDHTVRVWDWQTPEATPRVLSGHQDAVNSVAMSADERYVVSGSWDKTVRVWDWQTPNAAPHVLSGHKSWVSSVALSVDDQYVVSGSGDNTVRVWNIVSGQCLATIQGFNGNVNSVAWRKISNLDYLFTGSGDKAVRCWQLILVDHQWQASLRWTSTQAALTLVGAKIEGVKGLSSMNTRLLKQRGVVGGTGSTLKGNQ